ncbi:MAG: hypothetical protein FD134_575 [Gallionellaceae bacterium]|nr:MAG: hypothetical protein FD134_575 [Gallionellaceae bacterium]
MGRPRFVTAMALGACICENLDTDAVSADGVTPAWLVYEWFVVEAFVRAEESLTEKFGIPGIQKVQRAVRNQRPVSLVSYLKTPTVFGFTGVFRRIARAIGILTENGRLDNGGYELLAAWAKDQGLDGIVDSSNGEGHAFRERLRRAVSQGMEKGHTTPQAGVFWRELVQRLDPARPGRNESKALLGRILSKAGPPDMVACLNEALVLQNGINNREDEAPFLRKLSGHAPADLKQLLIAIDAYEAFGRAITDAFNGLRLCASSNGGAPVDAKIFSASKSAMKALEALAPSIARIRAHPTLLEWESDQTGLVQALERFDGVRSSADLFDAVLNHHEQVQRNKPPNGKRAWFERATHGRVMVRAGYSLHELPESQGSYVHEYRIPTFSGFLADLGAFR